MALWITLALLAVARAALTFVPSMWAWSLNLQRFVPSTVGWALWAVAALALIPLVARPATPAAVSAGDAIAAGRPAFVIALMAGAALFVAACPDRVWFVGDFLLRQYTLEGRPTAVAAWYPHALPLDLFLHDTLCRVLMGAGLSANGAGRALGALDAALLAALAVAFTRALELRGAAAFAAAGIVFWGGGLTLLTGYNKAFAELPLVVAAIAVTGISLVRQGRRPLAFALALAIGFVLHRSALGFLPAAALTVVLWSRAHPGAWRKPAALAALAVPAIALTVMLPRIISIIARIDPMHFTPDDVRQAGGVLPGLVLGTRLVDLANLVPMLSPLALAAPTMALLLGRPRASGAEGALLLALAVPFVGAMPFIHPGQGYYRDWDDFAAAGMTMSLVTAWLVARTLEQAPRHAWLALAAVLGAAAPSAMWLAHHRDVERGLARVETFLREEPPRTTMEQARAWDYLGWRLTDLGRYDRAADAFGREADLQPSPRVMRQWAATEALRGDPRGSQEIYRRMLTRFPDQSRAWFELARISYELGDLAEARRAAVELQRLTPGPAAAGLVAHIDSVIGAQGAGRGQ